MIKDKSGKTLIYDAFIRDDVLFLISTYWHYRDPPLQIHVNGVLATEHGLNEYEPVRYFTVPVTGYPTMISIDGISYPFAPERLVAKTAGLAVATLFKDDAVYVGNMIDWYQSQGVTDFYLYYNGPDLPDGLPTGPNIFYKTWDYPYWNHCEWGNRDKGWAHAAQTAFITMVRFRHLPDHSWLGFVDIDEHAWPRSGDTLVTVLNTINDYDIVRFASHWAFKKDTEIIFSEKSEGWRERTKCFYRGAYTGLCSIHHPKGDASVYNATDVVLLHIVNYGHIERIHNITQPRGVAPWPSITKGDVTKS